MQNTGNDWAGAHRKFVEAGGQTTQSFGLGRLIGQIYAFLYLSPEPVCLDDIARELSISKASVSITIRQLETWQAAKRVWVMGDRKDYYEAETDFMTVFRSGFLESFRKKFNTAGVQLEHVDTAIQESLKGAEGEKRKQLQSVSKRIEKAKKFHGQVDTLLNNPIVNRLV